MNVLLVARIVIDSDKAKDAFRARERDLRRLVPNADLHWRYSRLCEFKCSVIWRRLEKISLLCSGSGIIRREGY
jgi:hypothetical protein